MGTTAEPSYRKRVGYQAMLLGGFSTIATALLVAGNVATKDTIQARQREDLMASLGEVVPSTYGDNLLDHPIQLTGPNNHPVTVYRATSGVQVTALAYEVVGQGYSGDIRILLGLDTAGKILGARVLAHAETPGLGDKIEASRDNWILGFTGLSMGNPPVDQWKVKKDGGQFDSFSGATITPRAVVQAIKGGLDFFGEHRTELTASLTITSPQPE